MSDDLNLVPVANKEIIEAAGVGGVLAAIRPEWQAKNLIHRVSRLLAVDPGSACQRIFNASIHDLREKIVVAGLDIASEAAKQYKLPPVAKAEDIEDYSTARIIELAYRMGLLSRPDWRRLLRAYDIRKDLEHEDDEYEAGVEDCVYIFKTCVDVVLSKDPIQVIRLTDIKEIIEQPAPAALSDPVLEDYEFAPKPRQLEIYKFLFSTALNQKHPDIVRQNCYNVIGVLREITDKQVIIDSAKDFFGKLGRRAPDLTEARVAYSAGILPYLKKAQLREFFKAYLDRLRRTGCRWRQYKQHGELLRNLTEVGGLDHVPENLVRDTVEWLVLCYIGETGGYGYYGRHRKVFYSNVGAPLAFQILKATTRDIESIVEELGSSNKNVKRACADEDVERRFDEILDIFQ